MRLEFSGPDGRSERAKGFGVNVVLTYYLEEETLSKCRAFVAVALCYGDADIGDWGIGAEPGHHIACSEVRVHTAGVQSGHRLIPRPWRDPTHSTRTPARDDTRLVTKP